MSRIGRKPIILNSEVKLTVEGKLIIIEGKEGKTKLIIPPGITLDQTGNQIEIKVGKMTGNNIQGLFRSLLQNAVTGVTQKWTKTLELVGVGYRAETTGNELVLHVGFSHPVKIFAPAEVTFQVKENKISVSGVDRYLVGELAASVRRVRPPEPYKGKGIRYEGEHIRKKLGKAAKAVGSSTGK